MNGEYDLVSASDTFKVSPTDVTNALGRLLEDSVSESQRLVQSLKQPPPRHDRGKEAIRLSHKLRNDSFRLKDQASMMMSFVQGAPKMGEIVPVASAVVHGVTNMLDKFEGLLEKEYGLQNVTVVAEEAEVTRDFSVDVEDENWDSGNVTGFTPAQNGQNGKGVLNSHQKDASNYEKTPLLKQAGEKVEGAQDAMSVTPTLDDFGISNEDLEGLQRASVFYPYGTAGTHTPEGAGQRKRSEETVDELVNRSIAALRIETPAEVAQRFQSTSKPSSLYSSRRALNFDAATPDTSLRLPRTKPGNLSPSSAKRQ